MLLDYDPRKYLKHVFACAWHNSDQISMEMKMTSSASNKSSLRGTGSVDILGMRHVLQFLQFPVLSSDLHS